MSLSVSNPTGKSKAVQVGGGHHILKPGESAELEVSWTDEQRDRYLASGLKIGAADADRVAMVQAIISGLCDGDFTGSGKPGVDAINAALAEGVDRVSASERDTIWQAMQAE